MTKSIYTVSVPITDQAQADRMKDLCVEYGLPIWDDEDAFTYLIVKKHFNYFKEANEFWISGKNNFKNSQVTEQEFIELLKAGKVYLVRLQELIDEEKEVKQEIINL